MPDDPVPPHRTSSWGAMTPELLDDLFPITPAWRDAVWRAWWRDGGSDEAFARLFPHLVEKG